ncbi:MAG: hypothetical protein EOP49_05090 [Sphingobacteriales bacterium]|nr:MAG: hypothetical protein EOP49_05090 [Sphingobacteriales bacterium]
MRKLVLSFLASGFIISTGSAQTLFTYGNNLVTKQEFLRNYQKNTLNKKPDLSEPALKEYLNLYSLFRMKVKEAEFMHLDTLQSIQRELENYKKQLAKNYLTDADVNNKLIREAYDRMKEERHVAHILIMAPGNMNPEDSIVAYRKIDSIYQAATKKADFGELARQYSEDRGTKDRGGDIGFMTALQTLYPFENAVYATETGKISRPFRTQLGFHIVKVIEKRPARGEIQVAQILVATPKASGDEGVAIARKKVDSVTSALKKGMSFEDAAKKFSDDRYTINEGGVMPKFGVGRMIPAFEEAAFALKKPGDVSAPVQTEFGFHVIKLIERFPLKPYDSLQISLKRAVENDSRAQTARDMYLTKIRNQNGFKEYPANYEALVKRLAAIPDTGKEANTFKSSDFENMTQPLFELAGTKFTQRDMMTFADMITRGRLMGSRSAVARDLYTMYMNRVVNDFQENKLLDENEDFRNLMTEYRDGIMLFELMDQNVWGKASKDTVGLKAFYEANKAKYTWEPGFKGSVYKFKDEESMKKGLTALGKKNATDEDVVKAVNSDKVADGVMIQQGRFEFNRFKDVSSSDIVAGKASKAVKNADGSYTVVMAKEVFATNTPKSLEDARGYVVAEYQDFLEKKWNEQLRAKYPVKVEDGVFSSMVSQ